VVQKPLQIQVGTILVSIKWRLIQTALCNPYLDGLFTRWPKIMEDDPFEEMITTNALL
jgi:hypothetical protein